MSGAEETWRERKRKGNMKGEEEKRKEQCEGGEGKREKRKERGEEETWECVAESKGEGGGDCVAKSEGKGEERVRVSVGCWV